MDWGVEHSFGADVVRFPKLKKLHLMNILLDESMLSFFIPDKDTLLTSLTLKIMDPKVWRFMAQRGHILALKYVNWTDITQSQDVGLCTSFLVANP